MHTCAPTIQWWIVCLITSRSVLESNLSFLWICLGVRSVIKFTRRWYTNAETVLKLIYYAYRPRLNDTKSHWYYTTSDLLTVPNDTFTLRPKKRNGTHTTTTTSTTRDKLVVKTNRKSEMRANNFIGVRIYTNTCRVWCGITRLWCHVEIDMFSNPQK